MMYGTARGGTRRGRGAVRHGSLVLSINMVWYTAESRCCASRGDDMLLRLWVVEGSCMVCCGEAGVVL